MALTCEVGAVYSTKWVAADTGWRIFRRHFGRILGSPQPACHSSVYLAAVSAHGASGWFALKQLSSPPGCLLLQIPQAGYFSLLESVVSSAALLLLRCAFFSAPVTSILSGSAPFFYARLLIQHHHIFFQSGKLMLEICRHRR